MSTSEQELAARLTEAARTVTEALSPDEMAAIAGYQALDRTYELVAAVLRGWVTPDELTAENAEAVTAIIDALIPATTRWRLPEPIRVYRGQRVARPRYGAVGRQRTHRGHVRLHHDLPAGRHRRVHPTTGTRWTGPPGDRRARWIDGPVAGARR